MPFGTLFGAPNEPKNRLPILGQVTILTVVRRMAAQRVFWVLQETILVIVGVLFWSILDADCKENCIPLSCGWLLQRSLCTTKRPAIERLSNIAGICDN